MALIFIVPILVFLSVIDAKDNDIVNALVSVKGRSEKEIIVIWQLKQFQNVVDSGVDYSRSFCIEYWKKPRTLL